ncbi:hypothetical protein RHMOL_Rhmol01G0332100 [Rhododendron molle]|uniref:Uncharacterized protein n=1 Tax=Rhododendron molle TaxID=49168 RepID=A0ACC0QA46_RHOML|nr:hypothetical protein RHMOL_Rhmol01G0332100 [Rhododendron molle]
MAGGGEGESTTTLEYTPTWVVACVCTLIVGISLALERAIHYTGKYLKKKSQKSLFEALQKVKEELMLLGFISLLLTVFQNVITKICVNEGVILHLLPCKLPSSESESEGEPSSNSTKITSHFGRLLVEGSQVTGYCTAKNKVQLVSVEALHHLHVFIFVLAIVHVTFNALTVVFGGAKIREWKHWEESIAKENYDTVKVLGPRITHVHQHDFIRGRFWGIGKNSAFLGWLHSFFKQFYGSVTKSDYVALRLGFITTHCRGNPKFNFHKYMIRALEDDFKKVVGVRQVIAEISFVIAKAPHCFFYFNIQFCFSPIMWVNVAFDWLQLVSMGICCHLFVAEHQWFLLFTHMAIVSIICVLS